jgi:hypothetical protein
VARPGDVCPQCKRGRIRTRTSKAAGDQQVRYVECQCCDFSTKVVVPSEYIYRRSLYVQPKR